MTNSLLIKSFCIIMLFGCAETPVAIKRLEHEKEIKADWNKLDQRFASLENDGKYSIHPFFDVDWTSKDYSDADPKSFKLPYIVTTEEGSKFLYELNLFSGKLFRERAFCAQEDIWKTYKEELTRPNFTLGIIPRLYNEKQRPQEVILFANGEHVPEFKEYPKNYSDVRVVGSVIIEQCENYPCKSRENWKSHQILVGVPPKDSTFKNVDSFQSLKNKINWNYAKAMLTNMHGHHNAGGKFIPAYRVLRELGPVDTLDYFKKKSVLLTPEKMAEMKKWRESCFQYYDGLWNKNLKLRELKTGQVEEFQKMFKHFYTTSGSEFNKCLETVRPANILENPERLWFFAFIQAFFIMDSNGYTYNCRESTWSSQLKTDLDRCKPQQFEKNFEQAINGLRLMREQNNKRYRFVEYDNSLGGSHQAIFGWVNDKPQNYTCLDSKNEDPYLTLDIFPQDVEWKNYKQDEDRLLR